MRKNTLYDVQSSRVLQFFIHIFALTTCFIFTFN